MLIQDFDKETFLKHYWQQKPCVIKNFIPNFSDPIDADELAGLAQEPDIDSRIIACENQQWHVAQGPIDDFEQHCKGQWTLLVQGVDRHIPDIEALGELIDFIPKWRMDDVMLSYSVEGAGVGPHLDEYDVFIVQGQGSRRWQVGLPSDYNTLTPHPKLKQIEGFEACIDEVLMPGDAVYIPPKHPHNGVALENCINYSIGFRALSNLDLLSQMIDEGGFTNASVKRFKSRLPARVPKVESCETNYVNHADLDEIKSDIFSLLKNEEADDAMLKVLSRQHLDIEALNEDEQLRDEDFEYFLEQNISIYKELGIKPLVFENEHDKTLAVYIEGHRFTLHSTLQPALNRLIGQSHVRIAEENELIRHDNPILIKAWQNFVLSLLNLGFWIVSEEE